MSISIPKPPDDVMPSFRPLGAARSVVGLKVLPTADEVRSSFSLPRNVIVRSGKISHETQRYAERPMLLVAHPRQPWHLRRLAVCLVLAFFIGGTGKAIYVIYDGDALVARLRTMPVPFITASHAEQRSTAITFISNDTDELITESKTKLTDPEQPTMLPKIEPALPAPTKQVVGLRVIDQTEIARLKANGDKLLAQHDIISARLFYMRAAEGGDADSALAIGKTFDPVFLRRMGVIGMQGDPEQAAFWYLRARDLVK